MIIKASYKMTFFDYLNFLFLYLSLYLFFNLPLITVLLLLFIDIGAVNTNAYKLESNVYTTTPYFVKSKSEIQQIISKLIERKVSKKN
jgi:hypothetical protein